MGVTEVLRCTLTNPNQQFPISTRTITATGAEKIERRALPRFVISATLAAIAAVATPAIPVIACVILITTCSAPPATRALPAVPVTIARDATKISPTMRLSASCAHSANPVAVAMVNATPAHPAIGDATTDRTPSAQIAILVSAAANVLLVGRVVKFPVTQPAGIATTATIAAAAAITRACCVTALSPSIRRVRQSTSAIPLSVSSR